MSYRGIRDFLMALPPERRKLAHNTHINEGGVRCAIGQLLTEEELAEVKNRDLAVSDLPLTIRGRLMKEFDCTEEELAAVQELNDSNPKTFDGDRFTKVLQRLSENIDFENEED